MDTGGTGLRRRLVTFALGAALGTALIPAGALRAVAATTDGENGSGPPPLGGLPTKTVARETTIRWNDLTSTDAWAKAAIDYVAGTNDWMRDYRPDADGTYRFRPARLETRKFFARAVVEAFAPDEAVDPSITFGDLDPSSRFYPYANVAVKLGWMGIDRNGDFGGTEPVSMVYVHRVLVRALGLTDTAASIDAMHMTDGTPFRTPKNLGTTMLGMRLGLRYNNTNEAMDVLPRTKLPRAQVAYSLYRATTLDSWDVSYLQAQYADMTLPNMGPGRKAIVEWGLRYVGYPYVWGGEWGFKSPEPGALGGQPIPGFDCSGLTWWLLRANDGGAWNVAPPRPYRGWSLPQRASYDMATIGNLSYADLKPDDIMFYDGDGDHTVDHVDTYVGNGWAIDSSSSVGGVTVMWVGDGWYRDHFVHGRHVV
jgi:cell wall-associated NlpC family hydrolase